MLKEPVPVSSFLPILWGSLLAFSAVAQQTAGDLIEHMPGVAGQLNYSGVFSYEAADIQRSVRVSHRVVDGVIYERISYLDGVSKDQLRQSTVASCLLSMADKPQPQDYYRFEILGSYRVAGRNALKIQALPIDNLRYGYLYGIDQQTGLMLQSILISQSGRPLENLKYIDITIDSNSALQPTVAAKYQRIEDKTCTDADQGSGALSQQWQVSWMPPGFVRVAQQSLEGDRTSLAYTDGINVFSVMIDASSDLEYPKLMARVGPTQMAVTNYTHNDTNYRIVVSAEMPRVTVNHIALSVRPLFGMEKSPNDS